MYKLEARIDDIPRLTPLTKLGVDMLQTAMQISLSRQKPDQTNDELKGLIFKLLKLTFQVEAVTLDCNKLDEYYNDSEQKCNIFDAEVRLLTKVNYFSTSVFAGWHNLKSDDVVHILAELWESHFPDEFRVVMLKEYDAWKTVHQFTEDLST